MTKTKQNIEDFYSGDTLQIKATVVDDSSTAIDISGSTIRWGLFNSSGTSVVSKDTSTGGITITDAANGKFRIDVDPADTESLEGSFDHEAELTDAGGNVSTIFVGSFEIIEDKLE